MSNASEESEETTEVEGPSAFANVLYFLSSQRQGL